ncbi:MAG: L-threonylcarbamoyladenylate synthase, partial [Hyphomicrobiales bacterium]
LCSRAFRCSATLASVALRVPSHPVAHAILQAAGRPIAAPSANRSGRVSATSAAHVFEDLDGRIDAVLDGGVTEVGVESTIVACLDGAPRLLRPGGVPRAAIEGVIGRSLVLAGEAGMAPISPGLLASHYAPVARIRLEADAPRPGEAWLGFGSDPALLASAAPGLDLSPGGDLTEAAANLFGHLRALDAAGPAVIAIAPIPDHGLGEAINDRLRRAAAPR